jgi:hypothetical protein
VTNDPRTRSGIIVALGALGVLLVLLFFNSSPSTDLPPDQGPMAMALVSNMMTNGVLVDYDCAKNTAWVNRARCGRNTTSSSVATCLSGSPPSANETRRLSHIHH